MLIALGHVAVEFNTWMGFPTSMNCVVSPGHMRVLLVVTTEAGVIRTQTLGASCEGILTCEVFLVCNEHPAEIQAVFLAYKAVIQDGWFASG